MTEERMVRMEMNIAQVRERIFDGLSTKVETIDKEIKWVRGILVSFLVTALLGIGVLYFQQRSIRDELIQHATEVTDND